jgi:hypothetical protein
MKASGGEGCEELSCFYKSVGIVEMVAGSAAKLARDSLWFPLVDQDLCLKEGINVVTCFSLSADRRSASW